MNKIEPKDLLLPRMEDLAHKAIKTGCTTSRFLTPAEAQSVLAHFVRRHDVTLALDGGYEGAERVRAVFLNPDWGEYNRVELFAVLRLDATTQDKLGHRDILGAFMNLGIERSSVGDIISLPALICLPELGGYIAENLTRIGRASIKPTSIDLADIPAKEESFDIKTDTVASVRLDAVLSVAFSLPRSKATELIESGRVSINHEVCLKPSKEIAEGALLSVRGMGRAKLLGIGGESRKGRIFIKVGLYK